MMMMIMFVAFIRRFDPDAIDVSVSTDCTAIPCSLSVLSAPALPAGDYMLMVMVEGMGLSYSQAVMTYNLTLSSVSPNVVSVGGGLTVNITGYGFYGPKVTFQTTLESNGEAFDMLECANMTYNLTSIMCQLDLSEDYSGKRLTGRRS